MRRTGLIFIAAASVALLTTLVWLFTARDQRPEHEPGINLADVLGGKETEGFALALKPRPFSFPEDHGPHPDFRHEWWYYTGNLKTAEGRHFGFQLTFFRIALSPTETRRTSRWGTNQIYMAHFALTDVAGKRFYSFERFSRAALGLAGAEGRPFKVWLEDWSASGKGKEPLPMRLHAGEGKVAIDLELDSAKPVVLQGEQGFSRKGEEPGNASYYYSLTRMPTRGVIRIGTESFAVTGLSWLDREWGTGTSAMGKENVGWDWFALQLDDHCEVMFYRLRQKDGSASPFSGGTLVRADGSTRQFSLHEVQIDILAYWQSPRSRVLYPSRWRLRIPAEGIDLEITPHLDDQELQTSIRYWEGAVRVSGSSRGRPVKGSGYVELTGYEEAGQQSAKISTR